MDTAKEVQDDMQWFRWWHDGTTDPKLLRLSHPHRWLWIAVLSLASKSPLRGRLYVTEGMKCELDDVVREANLPATITKAGLDLMMKPQFGMLALDENGAWVVLNWDKRQPKRDDAAYYKAQSRQKSHDESDDCRATGHALGPADVSHTDNRVQSKDNNVRSDERTADIYPDEFEGFWAVYPRKVDKKGAFAKWKATIRKLGPDVVPSLMRAVIRYADECRRKGKEPEYILHAATFLGSKERWRDSLTAPESGAAPLATRLAPAEDDVARQLRELEEQEHVESH